MTNLKTNLSNEVRVRFAPSPTGHLHIGSVRTAMFNWLYARHTGGKYLVRVEDTDLQRSKKEYLDSQLDSLKWLNLLSDEPIVYQMTRVGEHRKIIKELLDKGLAYPCFCDPVSLQDRQVELSSSGKRGGYDGTCRDKAYSEQDLQKPHAIRFKIPKDLKTIEFDDAIRGKIKVDIDQLDDFVIMRQDGTPTYNFVVVVDDIFMKISHVIRGEDHISNTPKQILIYNALGVQAPVFAHLPLILGQSGNRLSKRDAAISVQEYKDKGFLADALFNYLVRLGWSHGDQEIFTKEEIIEFFELKNVGKKGAIFDPKKLEWLNGVYLRNLDLDKFFKAIDEIDSNLSKELQKLWTGEQLKELFEQYKQRAVFVLDIAQDMISLAHNPKSLNLDLIAKWKTDKTKDLLKEFAQELLKLKTLNHETLVAMSKDLCKKFDSKLVALAQPLRLALTGKIVSPGVFELIGLIGKEKSIERINFLVECLS